MKRNNYIEERKTKNLGSNKWNDSEEIKLEDNLVALNPIERQYKVFL